MDSDGKNSSQENIDSKGTFRKLSNDAVNRKYRRRSPVGGSSSSEGSPARKRSSSPIPSRKDDWRHKDDYLDRDSSRNRQGRSGESHGQSERQFSRSSRNHHRNDDYPRHDRHTDDDDRGYSKLCSHSHRDSRVDNYSSNSRRDNNHRSRNYSRDIDKHYRDRYEDLGHRSKNQERETSSFKDKDLSFDRVGSGRGFNNSGRSRESDRYKEYRDSQDAKGNSRSKHKSDRSPAFEESRNNRNESNSRKDSHFDVMELDGEKYAKEEKKNYESRDKIFEDRNVSGKGRESPSKKSKFSGMDQSSEQGKDGLNPASAADRKLSSNSKQVQDPNNELALEQGVKDSDIDAAKIAAMRAAELVNRNLIGTGIMTTDQKKKLLWGNKKTTSNTEESTHRWDISLFGDRERQEKFNKLMSLRLPWYLWPIVGCERRREDREQTGHPRCGEAKGAPDRLGEAIHCWASPKRWSYGWPRSLRFCLEDLCTFTTIVVVVLCCFAILELHVLCLTKLCILKFLLSCDHGLYWSITRVNVIMNNFFFFCYSWFFQLTHLCSVCWFYGVSTNMHSLCHSYNFTH